MPEGRPIVILTHFPPDRSFFDAVRPYGVKTIFSGHWHGNRAYRESGILCLSTPSFTMGGIDYSPQSYRPRRSRSTGRGRHRAIDDLHLTETARRQLTFPIIGQRAEQRRPKRKLPGSPLSGVKRCPSVQLCLPLRWSGIGTF